MMRALFSGVAGLKTHQTKMDVIGNNISNVNTIGFKSTSTTFSDIMYQTVSGASGPSANIGGRNAKQIGLGATTAATKISITSSGAAQSTGDVRDIKLNDSNSTNFFIVSNGTENVFTRAGSFYIDAAGNLAMTSTGYNLMGWQVDPATRTILKDTVSPLQVMSSENLTSAPEATTNANVTGLLDKNDTNINADSGYKRALTFYDNLGYSYQAMFSFKAIDADAGTYSVELTNIYESNGNTDILADWLATNSLDQLFGSSTPVTKNYTYASEFSLNAANELTYTSGGSTYTQNGTPQYNTGTGEVYLNFQDGGGTTVQRTLSEIFGVSKDTIDAAMAAAGGPGNLGNINLTAGTLSTTSNQIINTVQFDTSNGTFSYVGSPGNKEASLNMSLLGPAFSDISMNFSHMITGENGKSSTAVIDKGADDGITGLGKKLGNLTGLSINGSGEIYGTYDNGNTVLLGQIAVARFANASGLESIGNNCYKTTLNSGDFDGIGVEVQSDGGSMSTGQLEMSNVDLSSEFTDMITTQRGFQANSRIITTSDTLLEELVNLKR